MSNDASSNFLWPYNSFRIIVKDSLLSKKGAAVAAIARLKEMIVTQLF